MNRIVSRYESWIERYADDYKKKYRLERAVARTRRFVSDSTGSTMYSVECTRCSFLNCLRKVIDNEARCLRDFSLSEFLSGSFVESTHVYCIC